MSDGLSGFYPDLAAADFEAPLVVFHSRFSTNTTPAWERAQPFRYLCHNGEINTLRGNEHRMAARGRARHRRRPGSAPRSSSGRCSTRRTPTPASSTRRSSCWCGPAATSATPSRCSSPKRGRAAGSCARGARLLPLPRLPGRAVGRAGRARLHRRPGRRGGARPQRAAAAALPGLRRRLRRLRLRGRGGAGRGPRPRPPRPARPGRDALRRSRPGRVLTDAPIKRRWPAAAPYCRWAYEGLRRFPIGSPLSELADEADIVRTQVASA